MIKFILCLTFPSFRLSFHKWPSTLIFLWLAFFCLILMRLFNDFRLNTVKVREHLSNELCRCPIPSRNCWKIVCYLIEGNFSRTYPYLVGDTCSILATPSHPFYRDSMLCYSACLVLSWTHVQFRVEPNWNWLKVISLNWAWGTKLHCSCVQDYTYIYLYIFIYLFNLNFMLWF